MSDLTMRPLGNISFIGLHDNDFAELTTVHEMMEIIFDFMFEYGEIGHRYRTSTSPNLGRLLEVEYGLLKFYRFKNTAMVILIDIENNVTRKMTRDVSGNWFNFEII